MGCLGGDGWRESSGRPRHVPAKSESREGGIETDQTRSNPEEFFMFSRLTAPVGVTSVDNLWVRADDPEFDSPSVGKDR